ncbi:MAG: hypothetical protein RSC46_05360 [Acinetobacter sp.]
MQYLAIFCLILSLGLTVCQKRDTDTSEQDKTTGPHSIDKDKS